MQILNFYLNYPDDELANHHRNANRLGILDLTSEQRVKMVDSQELTDEFKWNIRETKILKVRSNVTIFLSRLANAVALQYKKMV